jgi:hypothetical protein
VSCCANPTDIVDYLEIVEEKGGEGDQLNVVELESIDVYYNHEDISG